MPDDTGMWSLEHEQGRRDRAAALVQWIELKDTSEAARARLVHHVTELFRAEWCQALWSLPNDEPKL